MTRTICVFTGSRSEYGLLFPLLNAIKNNPELKLSLIVGGMHSLQSFGNTIKEIENDGFKIDHVITLEDRPSDLPDSTAKEIASSILSVSDALKKISPSIVVVLGDRSETLATAIASSYMGIPVAHIHGGDNAIGGLDELARGAITKLSHIHFPATKKSAKRIEKMGEAKWRIFMVGSPAVDYLLTCNYLDKKTLFEKYRLDHNKQTMLLVQHSVSTESDLSGKQMNETLDAVKELGMQTILIYPNADAGGREMIKIIESRLPSMLFVKAFKSLSHLEYLSFMKYATVMIGNSSSAMTESSFFKIPVVNIGIRQLGRERASNVIDADHNKEEILKAIHLVLSENFKLQLKKCKNPYGDGRASERIVKVLEGIDLSKKILQKKMMEE